MTCSFSFETIPLGPFEEKALRHIADTDPVGLLKKCGKHQGDLRDGTRRLNWQLWTACYAGALGIRRQPDLFATLLADDYFKQRTYKADFKDLLRLALLIGTDAHMAGPTYKKACAIARRLQPLFDAGVEPMEVLKRIEEVGGLNRLELYDVAATEHELDADNDNDDAGDDEEGVGDEDWDDGEIADESEGEDGDDDEDESPTSPATARSSAWSVATRRRTSSSRSTKPREGRKTARPPKPQPKQATETCDHVAREVGNGMVVLEVEVTPEILDKVLNAARSILLVERTSSQENWQRIVGTIASISDPDECLRDVVEIAENGVDRFYPVGSRSAR